MEDRKHRNESRSAQQDGESAKSSRGERMKENHFPTRERHRTHRPAIHSQQRWRDETEKGAVTTVFFLKPFFLF